MYDNQFFMISMHACADRTVSNIAARLSTLAQVLENAVSLTTVYDWIDRISHVNLKKDVVSFASYFYQNRRIDGLNISRVCI